MKTIHELRCFCARHPLLAMYGIENGKLYIHLRIFKQKRIYGEMLVQGGLVRIKCRECFRWNTVKIVQPNQVKLEESTTPEVLAE